MQLICPICRDWKYEHDDFCGGEYCLKKKLKKRQKEMTNMNEKNTRILAYVVGFTHAILNEVGQHLSSNDMSKAQAKVYEGLKFIKENLPDAIYNETSN